MNYFIFLISTCLILGIVGHALSITMRDVNISYGMNVADAKKKLFGSNIVVSTLTVQKELRRQRAFNTVGVVLGILTVITIIGIVIDFILKPFLLGSL